MVQYRRNKIANAIYFFTVAIKNRSDDLLIRRIQLLKSAMQRVKTALPYKTLAFVILPDHLHTLWQLPQNDTNYSDRWKKIKTFFTNSIVTLENSFKKNKRNEYNVWQKRYWEHTIRDENDLQNHIDYIHYNPVKHGLCDQVKHWEYSSFHYYVKKGMLSNNWGGDKAEKTLCSFGE